MQSGKIQTFWRIGEFDNEYTDICTAYFMFSKRNMHACLPY